MQLEEAHSHLSDPELEGLELQSDSSASDLGGAIEQDRDKTLTETIETIRNKSRCRTETATDLESGTEFL